MSCECIRSCSRYLPQIIIINKKTYLYTSSQLPGMVETLTAVQTDEDESGVSLVEETYLKPLKVRNVHLIYLIFPSLNIS